MLGLGDVAEVSTRLSSQLCYSFYPSHSPPTQLLCSLACKLQGKITMRPDSPQLHPVRKNICASAFFSIDRCNCSCLGCEAEQEPLTIGFIRLSAEVTDLHGRIHPENILLISPSFSIEFSNLWIRLHFSQQEKKYDIVSKNKLLWSLLTSM